MISFCSSIWVLSEISLETSRLMLLGRPSIQTCHPPPTTSQCLDQPMSKKRWDKPPKLVVISFVLHSVKGMVIRIYIVAKKSVQNWMFDPGWWWAHKRRLELFAQVSANRDTSQSIDRGIQDYKILYVLFILNDNANIIVCDRLLCQYKCIFCTSGFGAFNL